MEKTPQQKEDKDKPGASVAAGARLALDVVPGMRCNTEFQKALEHHHCGMSPRTFSASNAPLNTQATNRCFETVGGLQTRSKFCRHGIF